MVVNIGIVNCVFYVFRCPFWDRILTSPAQSGECQSHGQLATLVTWSVSNTHSAYSHAVFIFCPFILCAGLLRCLHSGCKPCSLASTPRLTKSNYFDPKGTIFINPPLVHRSLPSCGFDVPLATAFCKTFLLRMINDS
jgi:hypothetical protein